MASLTSQIERQVKEIQEKKRKLREAKIPGFFIPRSQNEWNELARRSKCNNIHKLDQGMIQSGSNTTDTQFISYRAVCKRRANGDKFEQKMGAFGITDEMWQAAGEIISNSDEFDRFVSVMEAKVAIENLDERDKNWPGSWVSVKSFQEKIVFPEGRKTRKDNKATFEAAKDIISSYCQESGGAPSFASGGQAPVNEPRVPSGRGTAYQVSQWPLTPATSKSDFAGVDDESIVNTYAIFLLEQSSRLLKHFLAEWTMDRIKLEVWFDTTRYSAYTDGGLRPRGGGFIQASVEVKKGIGEPDIDAITKQETSQVVAMIKKGCPAIYNGHWLVASLDRHEAYLNFSSCSDAYVRYIRNGDASPKSFLTTQPLGPWDIGNVRHIKHLVRILVALTLKANLALAEAICKGAQELEEAEGPQRKRQRREEQDI